MENSDDVRTEDLPDDLTPFITRITMDPVGGGGFGDVWKCSYDRDVNGIRVSTLVAVKAFKIERLDLKTINRKISREIGILKILHHNNIVPLWGIATGFGRMSELRCLVSPWMPNSTLNVYLASNHNDLTVLDRSRMLEDVSAGLRYLHSTPVMHGDLTGVNLELLRHPLKLVNIQSNILIDMSGHARLIDFGLSTITQPLLGHSHLAATSIRPGAIRYAVPELVLLEDVRALGLVEKTDIYSFGCVMLQILSGRPPWSELTSERLEYRLPVMLSEGQRPQRPDGRPEIMNSDWNFIQKCLQSGPEPRPSADKVLDFVMHRFSSPGNSAYFVVLANPPDRSSSLNNLAVELSTRFDHRGNDEDLDQVIALHREALALRPVGHTDRSMSLNNLAVQLSTCFDHRSNAEDLDQAIALHREALALHPVGHPYRSMSLRNLAVDLSTRIDHRSQTV